MNNSDNIVIKYNMESTNYEIHHMTTTTPLHITYHNHDYHEVLFFVSGHLKYMIEGNIYNLKPGDILITNNKEMHKPLLDATKPYERFVLWIHPKFIKKLGDDSMNLAASFDLASKNQCHLLRPSSSMHILISNVLVNLERANTDSSFGSPLLQKTYLTELLIYLNQLSINNLYQDESIQEYDHRINDVMKYITNNLNETLTLDQIADEFYLSKYHLCRLFKKHVGMSIYQYIIKKRLIIAKSLLISGSDVRTAFINSGFSDYSNFLKAFKNEYGVLPKNIATSMSHELEKHQQTLDNDLNVKHEEY